MHPPLRLWVPASVGLKTPPADAFTVGTTSPFPVSEAIQVHKIQFQSHSSHSNCHKERNSSDLRQSCTNPHVST
jgi:hypothetical protein